jgi:hypothetical protein
VKNPIFQGEQDFKVMVQPKLNQERMVMVMVMVMVMMAMVMMMMMKLSLQKKDPNTNLMMILSRVITEDIVDIATDNSLKGIINKMIGKVEDLSMQGEGQSIFSMSKFNNTFVAHLKSWTNTEVS